MIEKLKLFFQDWSDACEYARECAPDISVLIKDEQLRNLLLTLAVVAGFWIMSLSSSRDLRNRVKDTSNHASSQYRTFTRTLDRFGPDVLVVGFVTAISALAQITGFRLFLFPEIGALSYEVLRRPYGAWAQAPVMLMLTPFCAGFFGTLTTNIFSYGIFSIIINLIIGVTIIRLLRSPIAPAISAGLLPLTVDDPGWWYPPSLLVGTGLLAGVSILRLRRRSEVRHEPDPGPGAEDHGDVAHRRDDSWIPFLSAFFLLSACSASLTDMRFLLFPPLAVIAFEMFAHAPSCPWAQRPLLLPVACGLIISVGLFIVGWLGTGIVATTLIVILGAGVLHLLDLHAPPALAVGLLPFVVPQPDYRYGLAVVLGTAFLTLVFLLWRKTKEPVQGF